MRRQACCAALAALVLTGAQPRQAAGPGRAVAQTAERAVVVAEIAWAGSEANSADEWIVLANTTGQAIDLEGWTLRAEDGAPSIALAGVVSANGLYLLERSEDDKSAPPRYDRWYTGALGNEGEDLRLMDAAHPPVEVDRAGRAGAWFAGESATHRTMLRRQTDVSGDQPAAWGDGAPGGTPRNSQADADGDTYFASPNLDWQPGGSGAEARGEDCLDSDAAVHPDAGEVLNLVDDDCDGELDEGFDLGPLDYRVFFSDPERLWATGTSPLTSTIEAGLLELIDSAEESIDAALYELRRERLTEALIRAAERGVAVRVVSDDQQAGRDATATPEPVGTPAPVATATPDEVSANRVQFDRLRAARIPVRVDPRKGALQHNKFLVVDGKAVWTGSVNWTDSGMTYNQENGLRLNSEHLAVAYGREFEEMFTAGRFGKDKLDDSPHRFRFGDAEVEVRFSPSDGVEQAVGKVLQAAKSELAFAMFYWTSDPLADIVLAKATGAGAIGFQGVWDAVGQKNAWSEDNRFCAAGLPLKVEVFGGKVHDKLAVVDAGGDEPVVITGSYNWTGAGTEDNDENTLIIHGQPTLAATYRAEVQRMWDALPGQTLCSNHGAESGLPACADGIDNDYDGMVDAADFGCRESTVPTCTDGVDNDQDTRVDQHDLDCFRAPFAVPTAHVTSPPPTSTRPAPTGGPADEERVYLPWAER